MRKIDQGTFLKHLTLPSVTTLCVFIICLITSDFLLAIISILIGLAWITLVLYRLSDRQLIYNIQTAVRNVQERSKQTSPPVQNELLEVTQRIDRRTLKTNLVANNIAGTVGRSAPIIREIHSNTKREVSTGVASIAATGESLSLNTPSSVQSIKFPPVKPLSAEPVFKKTKVAVIADEFTARAFSYEWDTVEPTPDNWEEELLRFKPDFLFVESAWEANGGSWRYHLVGISAPRPAVYQLIHFCNAHDIPTVFWNKEDPPHFEEFLDTAKLFDYVFTSDGNMIPEYQKRLGHNNVDVLAFAAQPKIHNPARIKGVTRHKDVVFGGMYFREKYPERREQMDMILPAAAKFNLDIFSRNNGIDIKYRFPDEYIDKVRGNLPYPQMLSAYHAYKAVINVNSVTDSSTMCARRIFEATACGAAVITGTTDAIKNFFPNEMLTEVHTTEDSFHKMRAIIRSDEYRDRKVLQAQRHIWENHTYTHRAQQIMRVLNIEYSLPEKKYSFFVSTNRPANIEIIFQNFHRQNLPNKELVILTHGFNANQLQIDKLRDKYQVEQLLILHSPSFYSLGANLNKLTAACSGDILFRMDDDDYYAENYAKDLNYALDFTGADLVGKAATYIYFEGKNSTVLTYMSHENRFTNFVRGATFAGPKKTFIENQFPEIKTSEDSNFLDQIKEKGGKIYTADRFNFMVMRRLDKGKHTWKVSDENLFASGEMKFIGSDPQQITV